MKATSRLLWKWVWHPWLNHSKCIMFRLEYIHPWKAGWKENIGRLFICVILNLKCELCKYSVCEADNSTLSWSCIRQLQAWGIHVKCADATDWLPRPPITYGHLKSTLLFVCRASTVVERQDFSTASIQCPLSSSLGDRRGRSRGSWCDWSYSCSAASRTPGGKCSRGGRNSRFQHSPKGAHWTPCVGDLRIATLKPALSPCYQLCKHLITLLNLS